MAVIRTGVDQHRGPFLVLQRLERDGSIHRQERQNRGQNLQLEHTRSAALTARNRRQRRGAGEKWLTVRVGDSTFYFTCFLPTATPAKDIAGWSIGTLAVWTSSYRGRTARLRPAPPSARSISSRSPACESRPSLRAHRKSARYAANKQRKTSINISGTWGCELGAAGISFD